MPTKFCSKKCYDEFRQVSSKSRSGPWICPNCKREFTRYFSPDNAREVHFCSARCRYNFQTGIEHHAWKGGSSFQPWDSEFNERLKEQIKWRDGLRCALCGKKRRLLVIHHIDYNKRNSIPNNLITLCISCHSKTNYRREYWKKILGEKINETNRSRSPQISSICSV